SSRPAAMSASRSDPTRRTDAARFNPVGGPSGGPVTGVSFVIWHLPRGWCGRLAGFRPHNGSGRHDAEMECQVRAAKRDAITVLEGGTCDRPAIEQGLIARPGRQIHENELLVGRSLDERMMTMDGVVLERDVVIAMPSD